MKAALLTRLTIACIFAAPLAAQCHPLEEVREHRCGALHGAPPMPGFPVFPPPMAGLFLPPQPPGSLLPGDEALPPFLHGLSLSEEQRDQLFAIHHEQVPLLREKAKAARKAMEALHVLAVAPGYDDAKAQSLAENGARAIAEIALMLARSDRQSYELLNETQRKQAAALKAKIDAHFAEIPR